MALVLSIPREIIFEILYGLGIVGNLLILVAPFTTPGRTWRRWSRIALCLAGSAGIGWSIIGLLLLIAPARISSQISSYLSDIKTGFVGIAIGILLLLIMSREFPRLPGSTSAKRLHSQARDNQERN
jgi:hypothetical protein